jgi:hypothetical protein
MVATAVFFNRGLRLQEGDAPTVPVGTGSFVVEDVEDAHPQREHSHPQRDDGTVELSISRMPVLSPKTTVIHRGSEHHLQKS